MKFAARPQLATLLLTLVAVTGALFAPARDAAADKPSGRLDPAVTVHFADLNTTTPAGVAALYTRIEDAAQTVCGPSFSLWDANAFWNWRKCYRTTVDHVVQRINLPQLTALHEAGQPVQQMASGSQPR